MSYGGFIKNKSWIMSHELFINNNYLLIIIIEWDL
jgi:hypothetical protein